MRIKESRLRLPVIATALAAAALVLVAPAAAHGHHGHHHYKRHARAHAVYVAPNGAATKRDNSCRHAKYDSIQAAVEAAPLRGVVVVCRGTYHEMVTVDRRVTLLGERGATIDATGNAYGVGVSASYSRVIGLTVENASPLDPDQGRLAAGS
jgi:pectin methylesterase-like acyl-CoA thioesterase